MDDLQRDIDALAARDGFSGVVRVDRGDVVEMERAYGFAHRALGVANSTETQFAIASGVKGLTAMTVVSLIAEGMLQLSTTARSLLGHDLPLVDDTVTIEHLLAHRSGIGDYLDEDLALELSDYLMPVAAQRLAATEDYVVALDGHPMKFVPGERFSYCNSGFVVLALLAERATGTSFHDLVEQRVCRPAGMVDTAFLRSDDLPGRAAIGYVEMNGSVRSNVFHLPVRGNGDGGIYTTVADVRSLWLAFLAGQIVPRDWVAEMVRPRSDVDGLRYGLGLWLAPSGEALKLEGYDAGVSFRSWHHPSESLTYTVIGNTSEGAWPIARHLHTTLSPGQA